MYNKKSPFPYSHYPHEAEMRKAPSWEEIKEGAKRLLGGGSAKPPVEAPKPVDTASGMLNVKFRRRRMGVGAGAKTVSGAAHVAGTLAQAARSIGTNSNEPATTVAPAIVPSAETSADDAGSRWANAAQALMSAPTQRRDIGPGAVANVVSGASTAMRSASEAAQASVAARPVATTATVAPPQPVRTPRERQASAIESLLSSFKMTRSDLQTTIRQMSGLQMSGGLRTLVQTIANGPLTPEQSEAVNTITKTLDNPLEAIEKYLHDPAAAQQGGVFQILPNGILRHMETGRLAVTVPGTRAIMRVLLHRNNLAAGERWNKDDDHGVPWVGDAEHDPIPREHDPAKRTLATPVSMTPTLKDVTSWSGLYRKLNTDGDHDGGYYSHDDFARFADELEHGNDFSQGPHSVGKDGWALGTIHGSSEGTISNLSHGSIPYMDHEQADTIRGHHDFANELLLKTGVQVAGKTKEYSARIAIIKLFHMLRHYRDTAHRLSDWHNNHEQRKNLDAKPEFWAPTELLKHGAYPLEQGIGPTHSYNGMRSFYNEMSRRSPHNSGDAHMERLQLDYLKERIGPQFEGWPETPDGLYPRQMMRDIAGGDDKSYEIYDILDLERLKGKEAVNEYLIREHKAREAYAKQLKETFGRFFNLQPPRALGDLGGQGIRKYAQRIGLDLPSEINDADLKKLLKYAEKIPDPNSLQESKVGGNYLGIPRGLQRTWRDVRDTVSRNMPSETMEGFLRRFPELKKYKAFWKNREQLFNLTSQQPAYVFTNGHWEQVNGITRMAQLLFGTRYGHITPSKWEESDHDKEPVIGFDHTDRVHMGGRLSNSPAGSRAGQVVDYAADFDSYPNDYGDSMPATILETPEKSFFSHTVGTEGYLPRYDIRWLDGGDHNTASDPNTPKGVLSPHYSLGTIQFEHLPESVEKTLSEFRLMTDGYQPLPHHELVQQAMKMINEAKRKGRLHPIEDFSIEDHPGEVPDRHIDPDDPDKPVEHADDFRRIPMEKLGKRYEEMEEELKDPSLTEADKRLIKTEQQYLIQSAMYQWHGAEVTAHSRANHTSASDMLEGIQGPKDDPDKEKLSLSEWDHLGHRHDPYNPYTGEELSIHQLRQYFPRFAAMIGRRTPQQRTVADRLHLQAGDIATDTNKLIYKQNTPSLIKKTRRLIAKEAKRREKEEAKERRDQDDASHGRQLSLEDIPRRRNGVQGLSSWVNRKTLEKYIQSTGVVPLWVMQLRHKMASKELSEWDKTLIDDVFSPTAFPSTVSAVQSNQAMRGGRMTEKLQEKKEKKRQLDEVRQQMKQIRNQRGGGNLASRAARGQSGGNLYLPYERSFRNADDIPLSKSHEPRIVFKIGQELS